MPNWAQGFSETGRAIELAAKAVGIGKETLRKAVKIKEAATKDPQVAEAWQKALEGKMSVHRVYRLAERRMKRDEMVCVGDKVELPAEVVIVEGDFRERLAELGENAAGLAVFIVTGPSLPVKTSPNFQLAPPLPPKLPKQPRQPALLLGRGKRFLTLLLQPFFKLDDPLLEESLIPLKLPYTLL